LKVVDELSELDVAEEEVGDSEEKMTRTGVDVWNANVKRRIGRRKVELKTRVKK
jgi:hypothetical protein